MGISRPAFAGIAVERHLVRLREVFPDCRAPRRRFDKDKAPRLAQTHGGRTRGKRQQSPDQVGRNRIRSKTADVAPPAHKLGELRAEGGVKARGTPASSGVVAFEAPD